MFAVCCEVVVSVEFGKTVLLTDLEKEGGVMIGFDMNDRSSDSIDEKREAIELEIEDLLFAGILTMIWR